MYRIKESRANGFIITATKIICFEIQLTLEISTVSVTLSSLPLAFKPLTVGTELQRYTYSL